MNHSSPSYLKVSMFVIFSFIAAAIFSLPINAGDYTKQTNLEEIADQMSRWSKQSSTAKLTPEAQAELSRLLMEASLALKEMAGKNSGEMDMDHHGKIEMMKKAWDPFDTADRM